MKLKIKRYIAMLFSALLILFNIHTSTVFNAEAAENEINTEETKNSVLATSSNANDTFYFNTVVSGYSITLQASTDILPRDTEVKVKKVDKVNETSIDKILNSKISDNREVLDIAAFDISLRHNDIEIQPESGKVQVSIEPLENMEINKEKTAEIFHVSEEGDASKIAKDSLDDGKIDFMAEHFSIYGFAMLGGSGGHTQADAEAWIDGKHGTAIDYDGAYGVQCVDLISLYYNYLGYNIFSYVVNGGYAYTFNYSPLPPGWQRFGNNVDPRPGDIVVFGAYQYGMYGYGHIGIVRAVDSTSYSSEE